VEKARKKNLTMCVGKQVRLGRGVRGGRGGVVFSEGATCRNAPHTRAGRLGREKRGSLVVPFSQKNGKGANLNKEAETTRS